MSLTKNPNVNKWVDEMVALTKPDKVVWTVPRSSWMH